MNNGESVNQLANSHGTGITAHSVESEKLTRRRLRHVLKFFDPEYIGELLESNGYSVDIYMAELINIAQSAEKDSDRLRAMKMIEQLVERAVQPKYEPGRSLDEPGPKKLEIPVIGDQNQLIAFLGDNNGEKEEIIEKEEIPAENKEAGGGTKRNG